jgi:hypothetical protein
MPVSVVCPCWRVGTARLFQHLFDDCRQWGTLAVVGCLQLAMSFLQVIVQCCVGRSEFQQLRRMKNGGVPLLR